MTENTIEVQNPTEKPISPKKPKGFQRGHNHSKGKEAQGKEPRYKKVPVGGIKAAVPHRRALKFENLDRILQEILVDELRHQKRCEEMCAHFYERVKSSETLLEGDVNSTYSDDIKALIAFSDQFAKFKPMTLKVVDTYIKMVRDVQIKLNQENKSDDLIDDLLKDN